MTGPNRPKGKAFKILIVDDDALNLQLMSDILVPLGYDVESASNGEAAVQIAGEFMPDLILLDVVMPVMDGFAACERLKANKSTRHIPVVLITSLEDRESKLQGLATGANDFLPKPVDQAELTLRVRNLLRVKEFEDFLLVHNEELENQVRERTSLLSDALQDLQRSKEELKSSYLDTIFKLTTVAEYKDGFTAAHIKKVGHYCRLLSKQLGWSEEDQELIYYASPMHDIGKVSIPSEILLKPGRLSAEEFALAKTHTTSGAKILQGSTSRYLQLAEQIAFTHHERWDGTGYPQGIRSQEIPSAGMIMNISDQYDALRSERPYKPPLSHGEAFTIISRGDGRTLPAHFDPRVLEAFCDSDRQIRDIHEEFSE